MQINDSYDYLIHLIFCAIHNEPPKPIPEAVTYTDVLNCAIKHDVCGFAYLGLLNSELKPDAETFDRFKQRYLLGVKRSIVQENARNNFLDILHSKKIPTLEIQGTKVKHYYPSPDLRLMGDIDIIINKEYSNTVKNILKQLGYKTVVYDGYDISGYKKGVTIEIHTDFFSKNHKFYNILNNAFNYASVNSDFTATVPDTVFWTYHLLHCLKHYTGKGTGIRRILDLYFLAPKMNETADTEYVNSILNENGLLADAKNLFAVADYWFNGNEPTGKINEIISFIKFSGTHGDMQIRLSKEFASMRKNGKHFVKLRYFLSLLFPAKQKIYNSYPYCEIHRYPYFLCWMYRTVHIPLKHGRIKLFFRYLKNIFRAD